MSGFEDEANISTENPSKALALELTCPICLQLYSEPTSLPCGHIYCLMCLQTMEKGIDQHSCPECQAEYNGTRTIVKNFKMCSIVETYKATAGKIILTADNSDVGYRSLTGESNPQHEKLAVANEDGAESKADVAFTSASGSKDVLKDEKNSVRGKMDAPKFELASQLTELNLKLEMVEDVLKKEEAWKLKLSADNSQLREKASELLEQIKHLAQRYSEQVMQIVEEELGPSEANTDKRVSQASELTKELKQTVVRAECLLTETDETTFKNELESLQPSIAELLARQVKEVEEEEEVRINPSQACPKLERMNTELKERLGEIQRCLRNTFNPSELTFDPETAHPNLLLSEDLKTVTFSAAKQSYLSSPQRFTSFFQVLSSQSFSEGEHCWEVELEGSPWIIGVCYSGKVERSGLPSALESSRSSWCLMWFNNLLTAFEQSHSVPLKRTSVSRRLEIKLSFKTHRLSFYNVSPTSGKTHIYTFKANLSEPVHLAYRMMSGHPKARVTICS